MEELIPNTNDGAGEKHVPVITVDGKLVTVKVGSVEHPSLEKHYIMWIALQTKHGVQIKYLKPGDKPIAQFALTDDDEVVAAFEYCNLHHESPPCSDGNTGPHENVRLRLPDAC